MNRRTFLATGLTALPVGLSGCVNSGSPTSDNESESNSCSHWCQSRHNAANTGYLPDYSRSDSRVSKDWTYSFGAWPKGSLLVDEDHVYGTAVTGEIYAVDAKSGQEQWTTVLDDNIFQSAALSGKSLYVVSEAGELYALNTTDGEIQQEYDVGSNHFENRYPQGRLSVGGVTIKNDILSLGGGNFHVIDISTGNTQVSLDPSDVLYSKPAISEEFIIAAQSDGVVRAIDVETTDTVWETQATTGHLSKPAIQNDHIYISDHEGETLHCIDLATGTEQWHNSFETDVITSPAVTPDEVVVGLVTGANSTGEEGLRAYDPTTGEELWQVRRIPGSIKDPIITEDRIYTVHGVGVVVYDRDNGRQLSHLTPDSPNIEHLAVTEKGLYTQTSVSHELIHYDYSRSRETGSIIL